MSAQQVVRPSTSPPTASFDYNQRIADLLIALKDGNPTPQDAFQAEVCLAGLHSNINQPNLVLSRLPEVQRVLDDLSRKNETIAGWTHVCIVKGAYLRGKSITPCF